MVVTCSFLIAQLTTFSDLSMEELFSFVNVPNATSSSSIVNTLFFIFVQSGLPGVIVTVTFAQLLPSIFSKQYPLPFLNIFGVYTIIRVALVIENIGIVKFVYVIFGCFKMCFNKKSNTKHRASLLDSSYHNMFVSDNEDDILEYCEEESNKNQGAEEVTDGNMMKNENYAIHITAYLRLIFNRFLTFASFCVTTLSLVFLGYGIAHGYSTFGKNIPSVFQFVILFFVLLVVFYCEGLKIAIVSTSHLDHVAVRAKGGNQISVRIHQLLHPPSIPSDKVFFLSSEEGYNDVSATAGQDFKAPEVDHVKRFLLGR